MTKSCEDYARSLNLSFSTNVNLMKCKTKCMAFLNQERELKNITLDGKDLPWVKTAKHLGCKIGEKICGLKDDLMEKRATYINKVNELTQEFHFAHPLTKSELIIFLTPTSMVLYFGTFLVLKHYEWGSHGTYRRE